MSTEPADGLYLFVTKITFITIIVTRSNILNHYIIQYVYLNKLYFLARLSFYYRVLDCQLMISFMLACAPQGNITIIKKLQTLSC